MKLAVKFVLIVFITFLSTPTVVSLIKNTCDTTVFYSMSEEELVHKEVKELKGELKFNSYELGTIIKLTFNLIMSENQLKHDNVSATIFSPPPNV